MEEKRYASKQDLGSAEQWEEVELPFLRAWVRVRHVETAEVARRQVLPDLAGFVDMVMKLQKDIQDPSVDSGELAAENYRYQAAMAHLAVMDAPGDLKPTDLPPVARCEECGFDHVPSLWSVTQTARMQPKDLEAIVAVALQAQQFGATVRPFSEAPTPPASPMPATSGTSTPPTNS